MKCDAHDVSDITKGRGLLKQAKEEEERLNPLLPELRLYGNFKLTRRFLGFKYIQYEENIFQKVKISKFRSMRFLLTIFRKLDFFKMHFLCL